MKQYAPLIRRLQKYFLAYGGWNAVFGSPLLHFSFFVSLVGSHYWLTPRWVDMAYSLIPSLLGFSLGTYAILFSLITNRMKNALKKAKNKETGIAYLDELNATFFHFIFVQIVCLFYSFVFGGARLEFFPEKLGTLYPVYEPLAVFGVLSLSFLGMMILVYAISLMLGAALTVYRLATISDPDE